MNIDAPPNPLHFARRADVCVTLRATSVIEQAALAKKKRFATELLFIATDSVDENIARVLQRAQGGGHGASERDVRAIHESSIANIAAAVATFERVQVYDSTARWCRDSSRRRTTDMQSVTALRQNGSIAHCPHK